MPSYSTEPKHCFNRVDLQLLHVNIVNRLIIPKDMNIAFKIYNLRLQIKYLHTTLLA